MDVPFGVWSSSSSCESDREKNEISLPLTNPDQIRHRIATPRATNCAVSKDGVDMFMPASSSILSRIVSGVVAAKGSMSKTLFFKLIIEA